MAATAAGTGPGQQRYELVTTLGKGGMAEVFLGWMHSVGGLRRRVAIKRILPELTEKQSRLFEEMFVDEARLAFQLEHDNIVRVYDVGQSANTYFIVMEYVEGLDLKAVYNKLVDSGQPISVANALYVGQQVAAGLAYAHGLKDGDGQPLGLVHNDISPPNILCGRYGEVKIADFGLSDARSNDVETPEGMVKGKFAYISPESTRDPNLVSYRSDIFSTGIVLWELLAGRRLFQRKNDLETFKAVQACEVPDLRKIRNDIPDALSNMVQRSLAKDPAARYETAKALYQDLTMVSYRAGIPMSRASLGDLVGTLKGEQWGFEGERVGGQEAEELINQLGGMLPPGVADHLKTFVTNARVADDSEDLESSSTFSVDWIGDVLEDAGLAGEIDLASSSALAVRGDGPQAEAAKAQLAAAAQAKAQQQAQARAQAQQAQARAKQATELPPPQTRARQLAESDNPELVVAQIRAEYSRQRNVFVVIAVVMGLLLGIAAGIAVAIIV